MTVSRNQLGTGVLKNLSAAGLPWPLPWHRAQVRSKIAFPDRLGAAPEITAITIHGSVVRRNAHQHPVFAGYPSRAQVAFEGVEARPVVGWQLYFT